MVLPTTERAQRIRDLVLSGIQELPAMPEVVLRVLEESEREDASPAHLERLISSDQALAARVLKVVNSAFYAVPHQVDSLTQAVMILGVSQLRNLVLGVSAMSLLGVRKPSQKDLQRRFWLHSLGTAAGAQLVAKSLKFDVKQCDLAFVGGLLHDVGRLFLLANFPEMSVECDRKSREERRHVMAVEREILAIDHCELGAELARVWRFPESLVQFLEGHHGPFAGSPTPVMAVHLASEVARAVVNGPEVPPSFEPGAMAACELDAEALIEVGTQIQAKLTAFETFFGQIAA